MKGLSFSLKLGGRLFLISRVFYDFMRSASSGPYASPPASLPRQAHLKDLEQRLSQAASELSLAHTNVAELERRMHGCLLKAEADAMVQRLSEAEDAAGKAQASVSGLAYKTQVRGTGRPR